MTRSWKDTYAAGFLKSADLPREGRKVKIEEITEEVICKGERPKLIAALKSGERWILNQTNCELLEDLLGSADPDDWERRTVELYNDVTVRGPNGEKGGIRVRESSGGKAESRPKPAEHEEDDDLDDLDDDD
jgi:hypothetical protein